MSTLWNDDAERRALLDGASALRLRAELIKNRTSKPEPPDVAKAMRDFRHHADILEEMAACYSVSA